MELQDSDFQWFKENYQSLFERYGDSFLAIKNKRILGSYRSMIEGFNATKETEKPGTFIVQHCNGDESGYTVYINPIISTRATV